MIEWRPIKGYEGIYEISNTGSVRNLRSDPKNRTYPYKILVPGKTVKGYQFVFLSVNGKAKNRMIHRLVAETFIPNPDGLPEVNHIDGNKENNRVNNLEWCTRKDNLKHAVDIGLRHSQCNIIREVVLIAPGNNMRVFKSMKECSNYFGFARGWLNNYIRKNGNPCFYKEYEIIVGPRGGGVSHENLYL